MTKILRSPGLGSGNTFSCLDTIVFEKDKLQLVIDEKKKSKKQTGYQVVEVAVVVWSVANVGK